MTPAEFRERRLNLGLSQSELAQICRVQSDRTIRRWEVGEREIPGPAIVLMQIFEAHPAALGTARRLAARRG